MFAVTGGKGGCGKTTTALGIARALARRGGDPLVVDADVDMPDLHLLAEVSPEPNATALAQGAHVECVCQEPPDYPSVRVVPAGDADATPAALARLRGWHGPVLVDCPAGAGEDATVPLRACDVALLVTTDTEQSLADARKTAAMADRLDTPVIGTLIRGPDADQAAAPAGCGPVERLDRCSSGAVLADERFRLATEKLSRVILKIHHMST